MGKKEKSYKGVSNSTILLFSILFAIMFSHSYGQLAFVTNIGDNTITVIDTAGNRVLDTVPVEGSPRGVAVTQDGTKAYVTNFASNNVSIIDTVTKMVTDTVPVGIGPYGVAVSIDGTKAYVTNCFEDTVSVIDTEKNRVIANVSVGRGPLGVAVSTDGTKFYVTNWDSNSVSVIDTEKNRVIADVPVGTGPEGVAVSTNGKNVYVTNWGSNSVSVIDTEKNRVIADVPVGTNPQGVAVSIDGTKLYVTNRGSNSVSVIDTATNRIISNVSVGIGPFGVAVSTNGKKVYVTNWGSNSVSVIDPEKNRVIAEVPVGNSPAAFGQFIGTIPLNDRVSNSLATFIIGLFIFGYFSFSFDMAVLFFNKLVRKKSFEQIHNELSDTKTYKGRILLINKIHSYLQNYTFEELFLLSLRCNGIQYLPNCHYLLLEIVMFFLFIVSYFIHTYYQNSLNYSLLDHYLFSDFLIFLASIPIAFFPIFVLGVVKRKAKVRNTSWKIFWNRLCVNVVEVISIMIISIVNVSVIFYVFYIIDSLSTNYNLGILTNSIQTLLTSLNQINYFYLSTVFSNLSDFNISDPNESNFLSLAGFYFSLAVGGTVVLSIADRYFEKAESLIDNLDSQIKKFNNSKPESLSLNLSEIVVFDHRNINTKMLRIENLIDSDCITEFALKLSDMRKNLKPEEFKNEHKTLKEYEKFILLIILTYVMGIITIFVPVFVPEKFTNYFLWIFIGDSVLFSMSIFNIFQDYRK